MLRPAPSRSRHAATSVRRAGLRHIGVAFVDGPTAPRRCASRVSWQARSEALVTTYTVLGDEPLRLTAILDKARRRRSGGGAREHRGPARIGGEGTGGGLGDARSADLRLARLRAGAVVAARRRHVGTRPHRALPAARRPSSAGSVVLRSGHRSPTGCPARPIAWRRTKGAVTHVRQAHTRKVGDWLEVSSPGGGSPRRGRSSRFSAARTTSTTWSDGRMSAGRSTTRRTARGSSATRTPAAPAQRSPDATRRSSPVPYGPAAPSEAAKPATAAVGQALDDQNIDDRECGKGLKGSEAYGHAADQRLAVPRNRERLRCHAGSREDA